MVIDSHNKRCIGWKARAQALYNFWEEPLEGRTLFRFNTNDAANPKANGSAQSFVSTVSIEQKPCKQIPLTAHAPFVFFTISLSQII